MLRYTVCVAALATMVGCASIVEGTDQNVTIITEPTGAKCDLTRDGEIIATASSTPTSVNVDKSKDDISVICTKEGHFDGAKVVESAFQGMNLGRGQDSRIVSSFRLVPETDELVLVTDGGQIIRCQSDEISAKRRGSMGVRIFDIEAGQKVVSVARLRDADDADDADQDEAEAETDADSGPEEAGPDVASAEDPPKGE